MRKAIITGLLVLLLAAPASWAGGRGFDLIEERLGLVESANVEQSDRLTRLEARVTGQEFTILRLKSRLACVEKAVYGYGKCSQTNLRR